MIIVTTVVVVVKMGGEDKKLKTCIHIVSCNIMNIYLLFLTLGARYPGISCRRSVFT